jgi:hypothetical protein
MSQSLFRFVVRDICRISSHELLMCFVVGNSNYLRMRIGLATTTIKFPLRRFLEHPLEGIKFSQTNRFSQDCPFVDMDSTHHGVRSEGGY